MIMNCRKSFDGSLGGILLLAKTIYHHDAILFNPKRRKLQGATYLHLLILTYFLKQKIASFIILFVEHLLDEAFAWGDFLGAPAI